MKHIKLKKVAFVLAMILAFAILLALVGLVVVWLIPAGAVRSVVSFLLGFPIGLFIFYAASEAWDRVFGGVR